MGWTISGHAERTKRGSRTQNKDDYGEHETKEDGAEVDLRKNMVRRERRVAGKEEGTQTAESHGEKEKERRSPLWAGLRLSGGASRGGCGRGVAGRGDVRERCCEGTARERPRGGMGGRVRAGRCRMARDGGQDGKTARRPPRKSAAPITARRRLLSDQLTPAHRRLPPPRRSHGPAGRLRQSCSSSAETSMCAHAAIAHITSSAADALRPHRPIQSPRCGHRAATRASIDPLTLVCAPHQRRPPRHAPTPLPPCPRRL